MITTKIRRAAGAILWLGVAACLGFSPPLLAQSRLIFPRVVFQQGQFSAIAIANPTSTDAQITLTAYTGGGKLLAGSGVINPRTETVPAGQQYARLAREIFVPPAAVADGTAPTRVWVEATSPTAGLTGFFLDADNSLGRMDASDLSGIGTDLVLPRIESGGGSLTEISIVNPEPSDATIDLEFIRSNGTQVAARSIAIIGRGAVQGKLSDLFGVPLAEVAIVRAHGDRPIALFGFMFRDADNSQATIAAQNYTAPQKTLFFPYLVEGGGWSTSLGLVNMTRQQAVVTLTAYKPDGKLFSAPIVTENPVTRTVLAGGVLRADLRSLFGFAASPLQAGWLKAEANAAALGGYVEYGTGTNRAVVPAQQEAYTRAIFSHQALSPPFFTGLAILNSGSLAANIEVTSLTHDGRAVGKTQRVLRPGQQEVRLIEQWVPAAAGLSSGSVFVKSDLPTVATQLFGTLTGTSLANVPPQKVTTGFDPGAALPTVRVFPPLAVIETGKTKQFNSTGLAGATWKVNGAVEGNTSSGTVTPSGLFKAPATVSADQHIVTLEAANTTGDQSGGASVDVVQRETLTAGLTLVTAVAYLENLQRFFIAEQRILSSVTAPGHPPQATVSNARILEQSPGGATASFAQFDRETIAKIVPFVDGAGNSHLLIAGGDSGQIYRLNVTTRQSSVVVTGLKKPTSMVIDPVTGNLLVTEQGTDQISVVLKGQFDPTAASSVIARPDGTSFAIPEDSRKIIPVASPQGIAIDRCTGAIFVTSSDGTLREFLGGQTRVLTTGLNQPNEILVLYRQGVPTCSEATALLISETNRIALIDSRTGLALDFITTTENAQDLVFFPAGSPFISSGEPSIGVAEGPSGTGLSRVSHVRVGGLYSEEGPRVSVAVPPTGAPIPFGDGPGDTFEAAWGAAGAALAVTSGITAALSPTTGQQIPDTLTVDAERIGGAVVFTLTFADQIAPFGAARPSSIAGFIDFDFRAGGGPSHADRFNPFGAATGLGVDAFVDLSTGRLHDTATGNSTPVEMHFVTNTLTVRIPGSLAAIGQSLAVIVVGNRFSATDVTPNQGFLRLKLDLVDPPSVEFAIAGAAGAESKTPVKVEVRLVESSSSPVSVSYAVDGGSAKGGGVDYTSSNGTLQFAPGETSKFIALDIVNDLLDEPDETIRVTLSNPTAASFGARTSYTYTILDDDEAPVLSLVSNSSSGLESVTSVLISLKLSAVSAQQVTVNYAAIGGSAQPNIDFEEFGGTLVFAPGETARDLTLTIKNDTIDETDETVILSLSSAFNATLENSPVYTYTILDDDPGPSVGFAVASSSAAEATSGPILVTLSNPSNLTVTVAYAVTGGSATGGGVDYTLAGGRLTFEPGQSSKPLPATIINDAIDEADETIIVTLSNPDNALLTSTPAHTYTIVDDDISTTVAFAAAASSGGEAVTPANLVVTLSAVSNLVVTVDFAVTGGTASPGGVDFTLMAGTLTFAPGETSKPIAMAINDDTLDETNETVIVTLSNPSNSTLGATTSHTYTIADNDAAPTVAFTAASSTNAEGTTPVTLTVNLSAASGLTVTVDYALSGTATGGGTDYTLANGTLTFAPGETSKTLSMTIVNDTLDEADETAIVTLSSPSNTTLGTPAAHTYTITDNDAAPTVAFTAGSSSGGEATTPATLTVNLSAASGLTVTVDYALSGTATGGGTDYTLANGTLTFAPGETSKTLLMTIVDDTLDEADETAIVTLSSPSNATLGGTPAFTYTIVDNDAPPSVAFSAATSTNTEGTTPTTMTVSLSAASGLTVTVDYALSGTATGAGTDYTLANGTLTFTPGQITKVLTMTINDDTLDEADETAIVTLSNPSNTTLGGTPAHTYTIVDNDAAPSVSFSAASSGNLESSVAVLTINLSAASGLTVTVDAAVSGTATGGGTDHTLSNGTLTFAPGQTSVTVTNFVVDDALDEDNETAIVTLSNPSNATLGAITAHTYTINDDDATPTVFFTAASSSNAESVTPATMTVGLSAASGRTVTVDYALSGTATGGGTDYALAGGTLTFTPGQTSKVLSMTINDDTLDETDETAIVTLSNPTNATLGATPAHTYTINDNDAAPTVAFTAASSSAGEATTPATLTVKLSVASGLTVTVDYALSGTATGGGTDYTLANGTLTFAAGETSKTLSLTINNDTLNENDETVIVTLSSPSNATLGSPSAHMYTIIENDFPTMSFSGTGSSAGEPTSTGVTMTVNLSSASERTVTANYTLSGTATGGGVDYALANGTLTFAPTETSKTLTLTINDDTLDEDDETAIVTLSGPSNATLGTPSAFTVTITDNDLPPSVEFDMVNPTSGSEGAAAPSFLITVRLSSASGKTVTVDYTLGVPPTGAGATQGADYADDTTPPGTLTFAPGDIARDITIRIIDDTLTECTGEVITINLVNPINASLGSLTSHSFSIFDNDCFLEFLPPPPSLHEPAGTGATEKGASPAKPKLPPR